MSTMQDAVNALVASRLQATLQTTEQRQQLQQMNDATSAIVRTLTDPKVQEYRSILAKHKEQEIVADILFAGKRVFQDMTRKDEVAWAMQRYNVENVLTPYEYRYYVSFAASLSTNVDIGE